MREECTWRTASAKPWVQGSMRKCWKTENGSGRLACGWELENLKRWIWRGKHWFPKLSWFWNHLGIKKILMTGSHLQALWLNWDGACWGMGNYKVSQISVCGKIWEHPSQFMKVCINMLSHEDFIHRDIFGMEEPLNDFTSRVTWSDL